MERSQLCVGWFCNGLGGGSERPEEPGCCLQVQLSFCVLSLGALQSSSHLIFQATRGDDHLSSSLYKPAERGSESRVEAPAAGW